MNIKVLPEELQAIHENKSCVVIGNGPSLNSLNLNKLNSYHTFGCNRIYLKDVHITHYFSVDNILYPQICCEIKNNLSKMNSSNIFTDYAFKNCRFPINHYPLKLSNLKFPYGSTGPLMVILAWWMGYNPIYLIGMDCDYSGIRKEMNRTNQGYTLESNDKWHFDDDYWKGIDFTFSSEEDVAVKRGWLSLRRELDKYSNRIINLTNGGKLNAFQRKNFDEVI